VSVRPPDPSRTGGGGIGEGGIATLWGITWMFVCLTVSWLAVVAAAAVAAQHRLDAAADLSALSAASGLQRGDDPCAAAARIAFDNQASVSRCRIDGADVVVTVGRRIELPLGLHAELTTTARAGP
jgi:secretion/DNA translocation related TadE-like protein